MNCLPLQREVQLETKEAFAESLVRLEPLLFDSNPLAKAGAIHISEDQIYPLHLLCLRLTSSSGEELSKDE